MTRAAFRDLVTRRLSEMGWHKRQYHWVENTSKLLMVIDGEIKAIPLRANMSRAKLEYQLGRLAGMAELLGLTPVPRAVPPAIRAARQVDVGELVAV